MSRTRDESVAMAGLSGRLRLSSNEAAAGVAGLLAGAVYLAAQMLASAWLRHQTPWAPLQVIAAMLLGRSEALTPQELSLTVVVMALLIHVPLSAVYGRILGLLLAPVRSVGLLVGAGFVLGVALFGINYDVIAPSVYPWFAVYGETLTLACHALFGALTGALFAALRPAPP